MVISMIIPVLDLKEGYKLDDFIAEFGINALKELMEKARDAKTNNIQPTNGAEGRLETSTISSSS